VIRLLKDIKDTVSKFADAIANVLDIDVIIISKDTNIVGNAVKYMSKDTIHGSNQSILGEVINTGKNLIVQDKKVQKNCMDCPELDSCQMKGIIGVPIFYNNKVEGVIGLIFAEEMIDINVFKNLDNTIDFLESMSDLLESKLQNLADMNNVKLVQRQREIVMDSIDVGLVYIDTAGKILYFNHTFARYFKHLGDVVNQNIKDVFNMKSINDFVNTQEQFKNKVFYYERNDYVFDGLLSCNNITIDGEYYGAIVSFESIIDINSAVNELAYNKSVVTFDDILGKDKKILDAISLAKKIALTDNNLLITGDVGIGKSGLGRSIHNYSDRKNNYFITVNCKNTLSDLLSMEIFGVDTNTNRISGVGKIRLADGGTLFFDEISHMSLTIQKKLNEILRDKRLGYYGSNQGIPVNVRMIFSTSEDLTKLVEEGSFNEELYFRITQNVIKLPSIKEHKNDFHFLVKYYLDKYISKLDRGKFTLNSDVLDKMYAYEWPGNNVELERVIEHMMVNIKNDIVKLSDVKNYKFSKSIKINQIQPLDAIEKDMIIKLIDEKVGKETIASELGISRATLYRKLKRYDINY